MSTMAFPILPILDLSLASSPSTRPLLLENLKSALFNTGFLYMINHDIPPAIIAALTSYVPTIFSLPPEYKAKISKLNSPHFNGYSGFAEEVTRGNADLREQFDFATEVPIVWKRGGEKKERGRDFTKLYWRLRGPNQWPDEGRDGLEGFREALENYMRAVEGLSLRFVHLIEEAFNIPIGTFDSFFTSTGSNLPPQHRLKIIKYPPSVSLDSHGQGVGPHKDSSGWLTFLLQVGETLEETEGLQVLNPQNSEAEEWIPVPLIPNSFVVNFGNAFEAATSGGVRATVHRVLAPKSTSGPRYSIPFFMGLPLDMTISGIKKSIPDEVHRLRANERGNFAQDPHEWEEEELGVPQLRKWFRSHREAADRWYGVKAVDLVLQ